MTTKNLEFDFDLQTFATETQVIGTATDTSTAGALSANDVVTVGAATNGISINGVYAFSGYAEATVTATYDDETSATVAGTEATDTYYHTDTFTYYAFSDDDASTIVQSTANAYPTVGGGTNSWVTTPSAGIIEDTVKASPITLMGGGAVDKVSLQAIGYSENFIVNNGVALARTGTSALGLRGVTGNVSLTPVDATKFQHTLTANGGATINASLAAGSNVTINANEWSNPTLSASGNVSLGAIDTIQTWFVNSGNEFDYQKVGVTSSTAQLTISGSSNDATTNYLNVVAANDDVVSVDTLASGARDTISINNTILAGAAGRGLDITVGDSILSAKADTAGSLGAGASLAAGGVANIVSGSVVEITAGAGTGSVPAITYVSKLANNGTWTLGSGVPSAVLGNDTITFATAGNNIITAGADGTKVAGLGYISTNTLATLQGNGDHTVNAAGAATWSLGADTNTISGIFDSNGNATVNGATLVSANTAGKTLAVGASGAADNLVMSQNGSVTLDAAGAVVTGVSSIAPESTWTVKGGESRAVTVTGVAAATDSIGFTFEKADSNSLFGGLAKSSLNAGSGVINGISSLTGNVTVSHASTSVGMNVMGTEWSVANEAGNTVAFAATGNVASISSSSSDLTVTASTDATIAVVGMGTAAASTLGGSLMSGTFNTARVTTHDSDGIVALKLESDTSSAGIAAINSLNSAATIVGDNQFSVNDTFNIYKASSNVAAAETRFTLGGGSSITVQNVTDGEQYSVTGGSNNTVVYDIDSSVAAGGNAKITVNSAAVTINASTASKVGDAYIVATGSGDDIVRVGGVKANDTVLSATDKDFTVVYDTSNITSSSTDTYVLTVNDAKVSLVADNLTNSTVPVTMTVAYDTGSTMPHVTISQGISTLTTVTVGAGVYNVGQSAQVTINDALGYLYVDGDGNVTAEDSLVADIRQQREAALQSVVSGVATPTVGPFHDFYNSYYNTVQSFANWDHTVASYTDATSTTRSSIAASSGVNIYGDNYLSARPNNITLQSFLSTPINVEHIEGQDGVATLGNAVIDVSNGNSTLVAVGVNSNYPKFATNHTILGGARQSTIMIGAQATGNNYVRAGNGGNYIYNAGGTASIFGGTGSDTIYASPNDHVEGGSGIDYFYDSNAFEIYDYDFDAGAGDVIMATKLSTSANINPANLALNGNKIAIAGGATLTVGASENYSEDTATRAIITNAAGTNRTNLIWAGNYDTALDASDLSRGALMISSVNGGAVNTVTGSEYVDTIYAGANDYINSNGGNDIIFLQAADSSAGQRGATVVLSAGKNDVYGWQLGFDNESGANILSGTTAANTTFKTKSGTVVAASDGASINFGDLSVDSTGAYNFLVGQEKVTFIGSDQTVSVNSNADFANYYKGEKAGTVYVGASVDAAFSVTLGSDNFSGINKVDLHNESRASIIGSAANESITVVGSADAGAVKSVASGAGNDLIVSGGNDTSNSGNYFFFGEYNGATLSAGRDTIQNFNFYRGKDADPDMSSSDLINLGATSNFQSWSATASRVELSLGENTKVVISDNFNTSDKKIIRARFADSEDIINAKFGISNGTNTFTYDGETTAFFGSTSRGKDTLNVNSELTNVNIWLDHKYWGKPSAGKQDTVYYDGISVLNASALKDTKASLVGNGGNNSIYGAGSGASSSLWGAGGESNTLIGGEGDDTFFYFKGTGYTDNDSVSHASNDVISSVNTNDVVWLYDVTLNDLNLEATAEGITSGRITVTLNDGSAVTVVNSAQETNFRLSDGQGGWTNVKAVNSGNDRHWE